MFRPPSEHYLACKNEIGACEFFLSEVDDLNLDDKAVRLIGAYTLSTHAVLEVYFESIASLAVQNAMIRLKRKKRITKAVLALICSAMLRSQLTASDKASAASQIAAQVRLDPSDLMDSVNKILDRAVSIHANLIRQNHGIKADDLRALFNPLGVEIQDSLAYQCEDLGIKRGQYAHTTNKVQLTKSSQQALVRGILRQLPEFEWSVHRTLKAKAS